jgi:hypothetical protein
MKLLIFGCASLSFASFASAGLAAQIQTNSGLSRPCRLAGSHHRLHRVGRA